MRAEETNIESAILEIPNRNPCIPEEKRGGHYKGDGTLYSGAIRDIDLDGAGCGGYMGIRYFCFSFLLYPTILRVYS